MAGALSRVQGRDWIQESYETGDPLIRKRTAALKKMGYRAKSFPMGEQVTQWGRVKLTMVDIRPGSSGDSYLENVPRANPAKKINAMKNPSHRSTKKKLRKRTGFKGKMTGYKTAMKQMLATRRSRKHHVEVANPTQLLFKTKAAARKYAKDHGAKKYSIKKVKAGR